MTETFALAVDIDNRLDSAYLWLAQRQGRVIDVSYGVERPRSLGIGLVMTAARAVTCAVSVTSDGDGLVAGNLTLLWGACGAPGRLVFRGRARGATGRPEAVRVATSMLEVVARSLVDSEQQAVA